MVISVPSEGDSGSSQVLIFSTLTVWSVVDRRLSTVKKGIGQETAESAEENGVHHDSTTSTTLSAQGDPWLTAVGLQLKVAFELPKS